MEEPLLYVLHAVLRSITQVGSILRAARHARPQSIPCSLLLLCDLPDAGAAILPEDTPMIRRLQSGVMAMSARSGSGFMLLVRRRIWDDAQRTYLGENQHGSCRRIVAQLLSSGETDAVFDAATVSPASLKGRFSHVLFSDISFACTPDTPLRMLHALKSSPFGSISAYVLEKRTFPQTALARLCASSPFSLSPFLHAKADRLCRKEYALPDAPALYTADALPSSADTPVCSIPVARECFFVRRSSRTLPELFVGYRQFILKGGTMHALLPLFQMMLLVVSAACGLPWLAALALLPAELWAFLHLRLLPGALLRLSLLPLTACVSLDALLCRMFARSRLLRLRVPDSLITPQICMLFAAVLLPAAMYGAQALAALLPVCLLWLAAPLIIPALDAPTIERIPLDINQHKQLRSLAEGAFFDSETTAASPSMRMLILCSGCMLGLLEPDEAARRIEKLLDALQQDTLSAPGAAAMLCSAQYLREHMGDCDAALRDLPVKIEAAALRLPHEKAVGRLSLFLSAARKKTPAAQAHAHFAKADAPEPLDLLFLPLESAKASPVYPLSLPLTHPHTFLHRQLLSKDTPIFLPEPALRFLFLSAAALDHPFFALLERSPVTGPYMPLLWV